VSTTLASSLPAEPSCSGTARPATSLSLREKLDRRRFEFNAVRRKVSGGLRGKGKLLIERVREWDGEGGSGNSSGEVVEWI